ncbi:hypothetical protein EVAR_75002_1 [Eumeta japonica]|uniref:Reverse transcriptase domain-containing protein n=1 Tax=Eumeta variegata TaxID=151549 RepID=A0A4C1VBN4_EUMVA|nr:hypothetical protein EVAR_75002_1 [Eumeta japonica]
MDKLSVKSFLYADDLAVLASSVCELQTMITKIIDSVKKTDNLSPGLDRVWTTVSELGRQISVSENSYRSRLDYGYERRIHSYTWRREENNSMIDFIIVDDPLRSKVVDTRMYRGVNFGAGGFLVVYQIKGFCQRGQRYV